MNLWQIRHFPNKMQTFPILTFLVTVGLTCTWAYSDQPRSPASEPRQPDFLVAQADPKQPVADETLGNVLAGPPVKILQTAREKLIGYRSVKATLIESVSIQDRKFKMTGSYLQGTDLRLRLEFQVQVGKTEGSMLEVCNGQVLWTSHNIGGNIRVTRRDVRQILNAAARTNNVPQSMLVAELGLGGLPGLLASLERTMDFQISKEEIVGSDRFIVIEGKWNDAYMSRWKAAGIQDASQLPAYVPDGVIIYFDNQNLFPRLVVYVKRSSESKVSRPVVTLDFQQVTLNGPVDETQFKYSPPDGIFPVDVTKQYLEQLDPTLRQPTATGDVPAN